jgi:hypothetical protein
MLANAIRALVEDDLQHIVELCMATGFEEADIARYCGTAESVLNHEQPELHPHIRGKRDLRVV